MKSKVKVKRVGRYLIDAELLDEGYELDDILEMDDPVIELPELFDNEKRRHVGWMVCPECGEHSQIDRRNPICSSCNWKQHGIQIKRLLQCAA